jgi:hypothetical protein
VVGGIFYLPTVRIAGTFSASENLKSQLHAIYHGGQRHLRIRVGKSTPGSWSVIIAKPQAASPSSSSFSISCRIVGVAVVSAADIFLGHG